MWILVYLNLFAFQQTHMMDLDNNFSFGWSKSLSCCYEMSWKLKLPRYIGLVCKKFCKVFLKFFLYVVGISMRITHGISFLHSIWFPLMKLVLVRNCLSTSILIHFIKKMKYNTFYFSKKKILTISFQFQSLAILTSGNN